MRTAHPCKIQGCRRLGRLSYHRGLDKITALRVCTMHAGRWLRHGSYFAHKCRFCGDVVDDEEAPPGTVYRCAACLLKGPPIESSSRVLREVDQERLQEGRKRGARRGVFQSRTPLGYVSVDRKLVVDPVEANVVKTIFKTYRAVRSLKCVIAELREHKMTPRSGRAWSSVTVAYILKNPVYRGVVKFGDRSHHGAHEPIVTPIEFNLVQKTLKERRKR